MAASVGWDSSVGTGSFPYNSKIHLYICKTSWSFYFLDNSVVTTVRGRGIRTLFLLIMESRICHWAANLLAVIMKVILLSMISILPTCLYLIFIWSFGFFFLVSCDMCCQFGICWWLIFLNLGHIAWSTHLIPNYKSLNCIGWDVNCIKLIYCICSL